MNRARRIVGVVLLVALSIVPGRAARNAPAVVAGDGPLSSGNVSLVTTLPITGMVGGRFVGNYFFATVASPEVIFEGGPDSGVYIFDASNPSSPALKGFLSLPHGENEDVDVSASRKILLVSMETYVRYIFGNVVTADAAQDKVYVVSWADPAKPVIMGQVTLPARVKDTKGKLVEGPGHIANCLDDCKRYAYITGAEDGGLYLLDLTDATKPKIIGSASRNAVKAGSADPKNATAYVHDVNVDPFGRVWATGEGGTAQLDVRNPLKPKPIRWIAPRENQRWNQSIHHNSLALDKNTLLVTEEDVQALCRSPMGESGGFQTWKIEPSKTGSGGLTFLDQFLPEFSDYTNGSNPVPKSCSSHWFTFNKNKVVAVAWYDMGVRFLDLSDPSNMRQIGYWLGPATEASGAYFVPGHPDLVYVADYQRGLDVIRLADGGVKHAGTVVAPLRAEWLTPGVQFSSLGPSRRFGWACRVPRS